MIKLEEKPVAFSTAGLWMLGGLFVIWFWGFVWGGISVYLFFKK